MHSLLAEKSINDRAGKFWLALAAGEGEARPFELHKGIFIKEKQSRFLI